MGASGCLDVCRAYMAGNVKPITGSWDVLARADVVTVMDQLCVMFSRRQLVWAQRERRALFDSCVSAFEAMEAAFNSRNSEAVRRAAAQAEAAKLALLTAYSEPGR